LSARLIRGRGRRRRRRDSYRTRTHGRRRARWPVGDRTRETERPVGSARASRPAAAKYYSRRDRTGATAGARVRACACVSRRVTVSRVRKMIAITTGVQRVYAVRHDS